MFRIFRNIRQTMLGEGQVSRYLLYALGEIALVVIGILIAIQIDNSNDASKEREHELRYLTNIKTDLQLSISELDNYIKLRTAFIKSSRRIIKEFYDERTMSFTEFNRLSLPMYNWEKYYQNNNTYQELINSGNFAILSNTGIKNTLLNLEMLHKKLKGEEAHYRFDTDTTFYSPQYQNVDINVILTNYMQQVSEGKAASPTQPTEAQLQWIQNSIELKNGFTLTIIEYEKMNGQMQDMKNMSLKLIDLIDAELAEG